jgi:2-polyprenyl-6-methoxyphenol hydroxylase-like FAD-dependent oxidoreductase
MEQKTVSKNTEPSIDYDVVIIGYGMVGSIAALLSIQYKLKVAVLEIRSTDDLYIPKAGRIDADVMRILEQLGFSRTSDGFHPLNGSKIINSKEKELLEINHSHLNGYSPLYSIYQPDLQLEFHKKIQSQSDYCTIFEKHRAEAIELKKDRVKIIAQDLEKDIFFEINTRFLLACNGQESLVPAQCDFNYRFLDYTNYSLNIETLSTKAMNTEKYALTYVDARYPLSAICDAEFHQRWEFRLDPDAMAAPDIYEIIRKELDKKIPCDFEILNSYLYKYETRILDKWQRKRIFISGDAAHVLPPYLGMGLSAGIKDVYNLIWKIALVADRKIKGNILDSYQSEREEQINQLMKLNMSVQKLFKKGTYSFFEKVLSLVGLNSGKKINLIEKCSKGIIGSNHKLAGTIFPTFNYLNGSEKSEHENAVLSPNIVIAAFDTDPVDALCPENIVYLANLSVHFIRFDSLPGGYSKRYASKYSDADGQLAAWFKKNNINYLIIRPDKLIFDAFKTEKQLNKAIKMMSKMVELRKLGKG